MLKRINVSVNDEDFFLKLFWIIIFFSFVFWFMALLNNPQGHQLDIFHIRMTDFWGDATVVTHFVCERNPYQNSGTNYPPLPYLIYYVFAHVSKVPSGGYSHYYYQPIWTVLFVIYLFIILLFLCLVCAKKVNSKLGFDAVMIGLSICLSGPMLFAFERGNTIILSVLTAAIFIFYHDSNFQWQKEIAIFCLAVSANIKLTPAVFCFLLICNRDWKALARFCVYGALLFILPFFFFDGGLQNLFLMITNVNSFAQTHIPYHVYHGTGLSSGFCQMASAIVGLDYEISFSTYYKLRFISQVLSLMWLLGAFYFQEKWKKVLNLTMILLIFPPVSHEYNILFLIPASVLFLKSFKDETKLSYSKYSIDRITIFLSFIMIYFVFRCNVSDFFNQRISVWLLSVVCSFYSLKIFFEVKHLHLFELVKKI